MADSMQTSKTDGQIAVAALEDQLKEVESAIADLEPKLELPEARAILDEAQRLHDLRSRRESIQASMRRFREGIEKPSGACLG